MATYNYDTTVPAANNAPKNDQPVMQTNTASISGIIAEDHIGFNTPNGGYHKVIHQLTGAGTQNLTRSGAGAVYANIPANIANVNQIIAGQYTPDTSGGTADTQLFSLSSGNIISQFTGFSLGDLEDGWQWLGGVLLQWGRAGDGTVTSGSFASGHAEGQVTFQNRVTGAIPFPNNCFIVLTVPQYTTAGIPNGAGGVAINRATLSTNSFDYTFNSNSSQYVGFYWLAIGN